MYYKLNTAEQETTFTERMMQMAWELDADRPIYAQLVERIRMQIVSGYYQPGGKLPSVRELAATAAVNPNTMQKAFVELERTGLIITQRTNGRNVTEDEELIAGVKQGMAREHMEVFFSKMKELGFTKEEIRALVDGEIMQNVQEEGKGL